MEHRAEAAQQAAVSERLQNQCQRFEHEVTRLADTERLAREQYTNDRNAIRVIASQLQAERAKTSQLEEAQGKAEAGAQQLQDQYYAQRQGMAQLQETIDHMRLTSQSQEQAAEKLRAECHSEHASLRLGAERAARSQREVLRLQENVASLTGELEG